MDVSIKIDGVCAGGNHIMITPTVDGVELETFHLTVEDFQVEPEDFDREILLHILRSFWRESGFTKSTPKSQIKTALESKVFKL